MNWITHGHRNLVTEDDDTCGHLEVGEVSTKRIRENDSFGPVGSYCMCAECAKWHNFDYNVRTVTKDHSREIHISTCRALLIYVELREGNEDTLNDIALAISGAQKVEYELDGNLFDSIADPSGDVYIMRLTQANGDVYCYKVKDVADTVWVRHNDLMSRDFTKPLDIEPLDHYKEVYCVDCKAVAFVKDTVTWRWYDFYAPQGDIPLVICKGCVGSELHHRRVLKDEEMARLENDGDNYHDDDGVDYLS